jgi:hypothetical protein
LARSGAIRSGFFAFRAPEIGAPENVCTVQLQFDFTANVNLTSDPSPENTAAGLISQPDDNDVPYNGFIGGNVAYGGALPETQTGSAQVTIPTNSRRKSGFQFSTSAANAAQATITGSFVGTVQ